MSITGSDIDSFSTSRPAPAHRVKFLCSHGGKILPRPADGPLKYIGGETRVISIHRDITFPELMKKVTSKFNGEMILKYQLMPDDLDVLVTVKSNEDIRHMVDECVRHEYQGAPRLRAFLFPVRASVVAHHMDRYPVSVSGIVVNPSTPPETASSSVTINPEFTNCHGKSSSITRHHSSPNLNQNHHQQPPPQGPQPHRFHHANVSAKPPLDRHTHKGSGLEHPGRMRSAGVAECSRQEMDHGPSHSQRTSKGGHVYHQRGSGYDDYYGSGGYDRADSSPSPDDPSSRGGVRPGR